MPKGGQGGINDATPIDALRAALDLSDGEVAQLRGVGVERLHDLRCRSVDVLVGQGVPPVFARRVVTAAAALSETTVPPPASLVDTLTHVTQWLHDENVELRQEIDAIKAVLVVQQQTFDADRKEWEAQIAALRRQLEVAQRQQHASS